jgi:hypothetical protein
VGVLGATAIGAGAVAAGMSVGAFNIVRFAALAVKKKLDKRIVYRGPEAGTEGLTAGELDQLVLRAPRQGGAGHVALALPLRRPFHEPGQATGRLAVEFRSEGLLPVAALALARRNRLAGRPRDISGAVDLIDRKGNPFQDSSGPLEWFQGSEELARTGGTPLKSLPTRVRLALEIAAHEEQERLFLASHLALLQRAWQEAEEIARIADDLLLPDWIRDRLSG